MPLYWSEVVSVGYDLVMLVNYPLYGTRSSRSDFE